MNLPGVLGGGWILIGIGALMCFYIGAKGLGGNPISLTKDCQLTGKTSKWVGFISIVIGIALLAAGVAIEFWVFP